MGTGPDFRMNKGLLKQLGGKFRILITSLSIFKEDQIMKVYALLCIAVLAFMGTTVQAQDSQESKGLVAALESASGQSLRGNVAITKEDAAAEGKNARARVQVQVMGMNSGGSDMFTGDLEVFVADGAIAAATTSGLPQVKVYSDGDQKLISQMYSKKPKNFGKATDLLGMASDFESLIKEVKDAKLVRAKDIDGGKQYRVTLDSEAFAGQTMEDIAEILGLSISSIERKWRLARAFLVDQLQDKPDDPLNN